VRKGTDQARLLFCGVRVVLLLDAVVNCFNSSKTIIGFFAEGEVDAVNTLLVLADLFRRCGCVCVKLRLLPRGDLRALFQAETLGHGVQSVQDERNW
jgi:hypothetical protein